MAWFPAPPVKQGRDLLQDMSLSEHWDAVPSTGLTRAMVMVLQFNTEAFRMSSSKDSQKNSGLFIPALGRLKQEGHYELKASLGI